MRKKIVLAFVLVTHGCVAGLGMATYLRSQTLLKERILSESTAAFASIEFKLSRIIETAKEYVCSWSARRRTAIEKSTTSSPP
ncbi:MAG: hypothetical protein Q7R30_19910 [Acidobacteriota bacterium]|nr:hypothetical protein [Acidobacteriota bacterium]